MLLSPPPPRTSVCSSTKLGCGGGEAGCYLRVCSAPMLCHIAEAEASSLAAEDQPMAWVGAGNPEAVLGSCPPRMHGHDFSVQSPSLQHSASLTNSVSFHTPSQAQGRQVLRNLQQRAVRPAGVDNRLCPAAACHPQAGSTFTAS